MPSSRPTKPETRRGAKKAPIAKKPAKKAAKKPARAAKKKTKAAPRVSRRPTRPVPLTASTRPTKIPDGSPKVGSVVADYVFFIFRGCYGGANFSSIEDVLAIDPNEWDVDPAPFYETLDAVFGVADPQKSYFDGYGGRVRDTVDFITKRWKGGKLPPLTQAGIPWGG